MLHNHLTFLVPIEKKPNIFWTETSQALNVKTDESQLTVDFILYS